jgi:rhamnose utilization protein RhaD (predicted bifunctional aldolase and dehydrogenase)
MLDFIKTNSKILLSMKVDILLTILKTQARATEMVQQLRALAALPKGPGSIPSINTVVHRHV